MDLNYSPGHLTMAHGAGDKGLSGSLHSPFVRLRCATMGISQHYLDILCSRSTFGGGGSSLDLHSNKDPHIFQLL